WKRCAGGARRTTARRDLERARSGRGCGRVRGCGRGTAPGARAARGTRDRCAGGRPRAARAGSGPGRPTTHRRCVMSETTQAGTRSFGPVTSCRVEIPEGVLRIEGTADPTARLDIRSLDGVATGTDPVEDGNVTIDHHAGMLTIRLTEPVRSGFR